MLRGAEPISATGVAWCFQGSAVAPSVLQILGPASLASPECTAALSILYKTSRSLLCSTPLLGALIRPIFGNFKNAVALFWGDGVEAPMQSRDHMEVLEDACVARCSKTSFVMRTGRTQNERRYRSSYVSGGIGCWTNRRFASVRISRQRTKPQPDRSRRQKLQTADCSAK